ncbi:MAG: ABC transporter permease [bacterium]
MKYIDTNHENFIKDMKKKTLIVTFLQVFTILVLLVGWELLVNFGVLEQFIFSKPSAIWDLTVQYFQSGEIYQHIWQSSLEVVLALIFGTLIGVIIAMLLWFSSLSQRVSNPFLVVLNALPKTALAPIFIIWVGTNTKGIVFVAMSISIVITIINALNGFNNVNPDQVKMLRSFKASKFQIMKHLILPANVDNLISITRVNIGMSWIGVIVGEFIVSRYGLGYLITYGSNVFRLDLVMMAVFILALLTVVMNTTFNLLIISIKKLNRIIKTKSERKYK